MNIRKRIFFVIPAFLILILPLAAYSQEPIVSQVEVEGISSVDSSLIVSMSGLTRGTKLDLVVIQDVIKKIYAMGLFSDVQIKAAQTTDGVEVIIQVAEYPKVIGVDITGNKKLKKKTIREKIMIADGEKISPTKVKTNMDNILDLYHEKGYFLAKVESQMTPTDKKGETILKFIIDEGDKVRIKKVDIAGNRVFSDLKLKKKMKNKAKGLLRSGHFNPEKYSEDKEKIIGFYRDNGYLDAQITSDSIWYSPDNKYMFIKILLHEGPQYKFGEISWSGNVLFNESKLNDLLKFKKGEIFSQDKYDRTIADIYGLYQEEGYLYTRIEDNTSTQDNNLNINYSINEGIPANVRKINIEGNTKTKEKVIRRELSIMPGQRFRKSALMRSLRNINYLNYFSNVIPDYQVLENGDVDLAIKVEEKPTGSIQFGAGYSQVDKLVGNLGLGIPNFLGNGQDLELTLNFGKTTNTVQASFTEPWFMDTPTSVGIDIYRINRNWYYDFTEERIGASLRVGRKLNWPDNYFKVFWRYRLENQRYYDFDSTYLANIEDSPNNLSKTHWPQTNSSIDFSIVRDSRDLSQFATKGSVLSWNTELAGGILGGDYYYHKHIFEASKYIKTFWSFVLAIRAKTGVVNGYGNREVPYSERFSPGGTDPDGVVRGYDDGSIGPKDKNGYYLRGKSIVVYNAEYQFPIVQQQIYGLLFYDMGNAWMSTKDMKPFDFKDLYRSAGFGVRLVIPPLGMIGLDLGYGFDKKAGGYWKPHFQMGSTF